MTRDPNTQEQTEDDAPQSDGVTQSPTQRIGPDGQPLEPPPGHGGRPQEG